VKYSRALIIITGNSGSPVQPMVNHIAGRPSHNAITPVGSDSVIGYRGEDIENAMAGGNAAVLATYDPSATANLQDWCQREGINTFTVFVKAPQELSFSRAMGNAQIMKQGKPIDTLLSGISRMKEQEVLRAYESGELACIDKPHYQASMTPDDILARFSSIIHSEPMWEHSIAHDSIVTYEPAYGPTLDSLAEQVLESHQDMALDSGYAKQAPGAPKNSEPQHPKSQPSSPKPGF